MFLVLPKFDESDKAIALSIMSKSVSVFSRHLLNTTLLTQEVVSSFLYRRIIQTQEDEKHNTFGSSPDIDSLITSERNSVGQSCKQVTVSDATCTVCKQLFYRPVVLNCGHVYCESCITIPTEGMLKCHVCECRHPSGLPKVCDELDQFIEEQFSSEYALRRNTLQLNQDQAQNKNIINEASTTQVPGPSFPTDESFLEWQLVHGSKFHLGVGCDMCGLCPIIGKRYQCKDCPKKCGYDLCGDCYNTSSNLQGRFNQKHAPTHRLELVKPLIKRHITSRQLAAVSAIAARNQSIPANSSLRFPSTDEDGVSSHSNVLSSATSEDQTDNQHSI